MQGKPDTGGPLFGQWHGTAGNRAHYYLGGKALCGTLSPAGAPVEFRAGYHKSKAGGVVVAYCPECAEKNAERWYCVPTKPPGVM